MRCLWRSISVLRFSVLPTTNELMVENKFVIIVVLYIIVSGRDRLGMTIHSVELVASLM